MGLDLFPIVLAMKVPSSCVAVPGPFGSINVDLMFGRVRIDVGKVEQ